VLEAFLDAALIADEKENALVLRLSLETLVGTDFRTCLTGVKVERRSVKYGGGAGGADEP
jgi:hypothetical protein